MIVKLNYLYYIATIQETIGVNELIILNRIICVGLQYLK